MNKTKSIFAIVVVAAAIFVVGHSLRGKKVLLTVYHPVLESLKDADAVLAQGPNAAGRFAFSSARSSAVSASDSSSGPRSQTSVLSPTLSEAQQEKRSLEALSSVLFESSRIDATPGNLVKRLSYEGLKPVASRDDDPATGSLIVIRTEDALPGTRYFQAQFFSDEDGNYNPQSLSFELKPGTPLPTVLKSLEASGFDLRSVDYNDQSFHRWILPDHKELTIQKLTKRDIAEGIPGTAHSTEDEGALIVAITEAIAGHEDE